MSMREVRELVNNLTEQPEDGMEYDSFKGGKKQRRKGERQNNP